MRATFADLYQQAFADFGSRALWNVRQYDHPEPADALAVAKALRLEGNLQARILAERIEAACSALV